MLVKVDVRNVTPTTKTLTVELEPNLTVYEANEAIVAALGGGLFNLQFNGKALRPLDSTLAAHGVTCGSKLTCIPCGLRRG